MAAADPEVEVEAEDEDGGDDQDVNAEVVPRDALVMRQILKAMGAHDFQPRVVNQMLEFTYRYVHQVLLDAQDYQEHRGQPELGRDDVRLAKKQQDLTSFQNPPPVETLLKMAASANQLALPVVPSEPRVMLPPASQCLIAQNYQVLPKKAEYTVYDSEEEEEEEEKGDADMAT